MPLDWISKIIIGLKLFDLLSTLSLIPDVMNETHDRLREHLN